MFCLADQQTAQPQLIRERRYTLRACETILRGSGEWSRGSCAQEDGSARPGSGSVASAANANAPRRLSMRPQRPHGQTPWPPLACPTSPLRLWLGRRAPRRRPSEDVLDSQQQIVGQRDPLRDTADLAQAPDAQLL